MIGFAIISGKVHVRARQTIVEDIQGCRGLNGRWSRSCSTVIRGWEKKRGDDCQSYPIQHIIFVTTRKREIPPGNYKTLLELQSHTMNVILPPLVIEVTNGLHFSTVGSRKPAHGRNSCHDSCPPFRPPTSEPLDCASTASSIGHTGRLSLLQPLAVSHAFSRPSRDDIWVPA